MSVMFLMAFGARGSLTRVPQRRVEFELVKRPGDEFDGSVDDLMENNNLV